MKNLNPALKVVALLLFYAAVTLPVKTYAALAGVYTIDSSQAATLTNYRDFVSAISDMRLGTRSDGGTPNGAGVTGPVVFNVAAGTWVGQLDITGITGVSATNQITFDGGTGNAATRIIQFNATSLATAFTVRINNQQFINLRNLSIVGTGTSFAWPLHIFNTSSNVKVKNCIIQFTSAFSAHTSTNFAALVLNNSTASPTSAGSAAINVEIDSNRIVGGNGNYLIGNGLNTGIFFRRNQVDSSFLYGVFAQSVGALSINNNNINMLSAGNLSSAGIYLNSNPPTTSSFHQINGNSIIQAGLYGIYISSTNALATPRCQLINNAIGGGFRNTGNPAGIYFTSTYGWDVFHNSVNLDNVATGTQAAAFYFNNCCTTGSTLLDIRNNIFAVTAVGSSAYTFYYSSISSFQYVVTTTAALNFNNYFKAGIQSTQPTVYYGGSVLTPANLIGNGGYNTNSIITDPTFTSRFNLRPLNPCNNGTAIAGIATDLAGATRNTPPDIGAYEVTPVNNDIGVERITSPALPFSAGNQNITVVLRNYGSNTITSANVSYSVNGGFPVTLPFTGSIAPCGTANFTFSGGSQFNFSPNTPYQIKVYTDNPNNNADAVPANDTASIPLIYSGLSGNYTIDQSQPASPTNFTSFTSAALALNNGGVSGPVFFSVQGSTPYVEQIKLVNISGTSATNTITFDGGAGNAANRIITFAATLQAESHTIRIENTPWVNIRNLTIRGTGASFAWPMHIFGNNSSNIKVKNCMINFTGGNGVTGTSDNFTGIVLNGSTTSLYSNSSAINVELDSNTIDGGNSGMFIYTQNSNNITMINNRINNANLYGIYFYYTTAFRCNNNIINMRPTGASNSMGIYANFPANSGTYAKEIIGNVITDAGQYGLNLYYLQGTTSQRARVVNNMVGGNFRNTDPAGIYMNQNCTNVDVWFNSVNVDNVATTAQAAALRILFNCSGLDVRNNNLAVTNSTSTAFALFCDNQSSFNQLDYNNYFKAGSPLRLIGIGTNIYSPGNMRGALGFNSNAVSINPSYISAKNLSTNLVCNHGIAIPGISRDFEDNIRNNPPDIGADESINQAALDLSLQQILSPQIPIPVGAQNIRVVVRNNGSTPVTSASVNYSVNGGALQTVNWAGTLAPCDSVSVEFNATSGPGASDQRFTFLPGVSYTILAFVANPNGSPDLLTANDSLIMGPLCAALAGNYTIDSAASVQTSTTFTSVAAAANALSCGGVAGPVSFDVLQGSYIGQIDIANVSGVSATNTIEFNGGAGNAATRIISFGATATNSLHTLRINNTQFVTLRNLTIRGTGASFGWPLHLLNNTSNTRVKNCIIDFTGNGLNGTSDNYVGIVMNNWSASASPTNSSSPSVNVEIDSNNIRGANSSVYLVGNGNNTNIFFRNNALDSANLYGLYAQSLIGAKMNNNAVNMRANGSTASYGFFLSSVSGTASSFPELNRNKIINAGQYGIYVASSTANAANRAQMINNAIGGGFRNSTPYGIFLTSSSNWNIWFNSVNIDNAATGTAGALFIQSTSTLNDVRNNNLALTQPSVGINMLPLRSAAGCTFTALNFNNYFRPSTTNQLINVNGINFDTLNYNTLAAGGVNSIRNNPQFAGSRDLTINTGANNGVFIPSVTTDINNSIRNNPPDIGAYETSSGLAVDLGIVNLISPDTFLSSGLRDVSVLIRNFGTTPITSFNLRHTINGTAMQDSLFTGLNLAINDTFRVTLSGSKRANFLTGILNTFRVYIHQPNGGTDNNNINDTITVGPKFSALNGNYTINPSGSGATNFTTFRAATNALGFAGVAGPVVFTVSPATYNEQVNIGIVSGASVTNTVTFNGTNVATCIIDTAANTTTNYHTVRLTNASFVTLRNLTIRSSGASFGVGLQISGNSNFSRIKNCVIEISGAAASSTSSNFIAVLMSNATNVSSPGVSGQQITGFELDSNIINNGYYGIYTYGNTGTPYANDNRIRFNQILNAFYYGVYTAYYEALNFSNNTVNMRTPGTVNAYGFYMQSAQNTLERIHRINANRFFNSGNYGIYITSSGSGTTGRNQLNNNMVAGGFRTPNSYGIYLTSVTNFDVLHNSVNIDISTNNIQYASLYLSSGTNIDIRNNIFAHSGATGSVGIPVYVANLPGGLFRLDFNNYFKTSTTNTNLVYLAGPTYTNSNYKGALGYNMNSINVNPQFVSSTDLRIGNGCNNGFNTGLVSTDIDGDLRNNPPDIGCDEYVGLNNDIGVVSVAPFGAGAQNVRVVIRNFGGNTVTSALVGYSVNGGLARVVTFSGSLAPCDTASVIFSGANQFTFNFGVSYTIAAYTSAPNGLIDSRQSNDTTILGPTCVFLNGIYTINPAGSGSNNFTSFTSAVAALNCGGVSSPIVFNVASGTYNEQLSLLPTIVGSPANSITFQSASGNPTAVTLTFNATSTSNNYTVNLAGASNIRFRNMTISATNASFGTALLINNNASNDSFFNVVFNSPITTSNSTNLAVINCPTPTISNFISFDTCRINNGAYGSFFSSSGSTTLGQSSQTPTFNNCDFINQYAYGIYNSNIEGVQITKNRITTNSTLTSYNAIYNYWITIQADISRPLITQNFISGGLGGFGIYNNYLGVNSSITAARRPLIANNMVTIGVGANATYGIYDANSNWADYFHNSVNIGCNQTANTSAAGCFVSTSYGNSAILNNVFAAFNGAPAFRMDNNTFYPTCNFNNFYTNGPNLAFFSSAPYSSMSAWRVASSRDANSVNLPPNFISQTDLRLTSGCINGTPIAGLNTDIDGKTRANPPDMGAAEFTGSILNDIGLSMLQSPVIPFSPGLQDIRVVINNYGSNAVTSATVKYRVNGGAPVSASFSGALLACDTSGVLFTGANRVNFVLGTSYLLQVWTEQPNGLSDNNRTNDTITVTICPSLNGAYTINPAGSGPTNFTSFTAAAAALNCGGVNGPVNITVAPGVYNEQFTLSGVQGLSSVNRLAINGVSAASRTITFNPTVNTLGHTVRIQNSPFVAIRNLTILSSGTNFGAPVHILGSSSNTSVKNCIISFTGSAASSNSSAFNGVIINNTADVTNPTGSGSMGSGIEIDSNNIRFGFYGICVSGQTNTPYLNSIFLRNNNIDSAFSAGIYTYYTEAFKILNNTIRMRISGTNNSFGMSLNFGFSSNSALFHEIIGNSIYNAGQYGIYNYYNNNPSSARGRFYNNVIGGGFRSTNACGVYWQYADFWDIYHNSIILGINTASAQNAAIFLDHFSTFNLDIRNNHFVYAATGGAGLPLYTNSAISTINYNNYFNQSSANLLFRAGITYTASTYQTAAGGGLNALNVNPSFASNFNLRNGGCIKGIAIPAVTTDNEGVIRNSPPDIGAYEARNNDAGVVAVLSPIPPISPGLQNVNVQIKNFGANVINTISVSYSVNGSAPVTQNLTALNLQPCSTATVVFSGAQQFNFTAGSSNIIAYSAQPNGAADVNRNNDTININLCGPLNGSYTINPSGSGASNFTSFNAAIAAMQCAGITGPVVFDVAAATYNEQVDIPAISGASSTNTITFDGGNGNVASRILTFAASINNLRHTVRFNNCQFVTIRNLTIQTTGPGLGWGVHYFGNAHNNRIANCRIDIAGVNAPTSTSNAFIGIVGSNSATSENSTVQINNAVIDSSVISNGYYSIIFRGSSAATSTGLTIRANALNGSYFYGVYNEYHDSIAIINNTITGRVISPLNTNAYGIYIANMNSSNGRILNISGNAIFDISAYGISINSSSNSAARNRLWNNMIGGGFSSPNATGISFSSSNNWDIFHNTVNLDFSTSNQSSSALYIAFGSNMSTRNNILAYTASSGAGLPYYGLVTSSYGVSSAFNYNMFFKQGINATAPLIYHGGTYTSTNFVGGNGSNFNSILNAPVFFGNRNLRVYDGCYNGDSLGVTTDIDGNIRANFGDMGADEVPSGINDIGVKALLNPAIPLTSGLQDIRVIIKNYGNNLITGGTVKYSINNGAPVSLVFTDTLTPCDTAIIRFTGSNQFNFIGGNIYTIRVYTESPNGNPDTYNQNDTFSTGTLCTAISGVYTINPAGSGSTNFTTFDAAISALQCSGVSGPVTFNVAAGTYNTQVVIPVIAGASVANTITFNGAGRNNTTVTFAATSNAASHTIRLLNTGFINLQNMTIAGTGNSNAWPLHIMNSSNIKVKNCRIEITGNGAAGTNNAFVPVMVNGSTTSATTQTLTDSVEIDSNIINGGFASVWIYNNNGANNRIRWNTLNNPFYYGVYGFIITELKVIGNTINMLPTGNINSTGVYMQSCNASTGQVHEISGNQIFDMGQYGIYCGFSYGIFGTPSRISNNMITGFRNTSAHYGIFAEYCGSWGIWFNSILSDTISTNPNGVLHITNSNQMDVRNNILAVSSSASAQIPFYAATAGNISVLNFNNYFKPGNSNPLIFAGVNYSSSNFIGGGGLNQNSISRDPFFTSRRDLHINNTCNNGVQVAVVTNDIDGQVRLNPPDMGADELTGGISNNAGVSVMLSPTIPLNSGLQNISLIVSNLGNNMIAGVNVHYSVNNAAPVSLFIPDTILPCDTQLVVFSGANQYNFAPGISYTIKAYTSLPNGVADNNNLDDTLTVGPICPAMSGNYTIDPAGSGPNNFITFGAAAAAMQCAGISDDVYFTVANGTYNEQVNIGAVTGVNDTTRVWFTGNSQSGTILTFGPTTANAAHTLRINNSPYVSFRNMTIQSTGAIVGVPVHILGSSHEARIKNCNIRITGSGATSGNTGYIGVLINGGTDVNNPLSGTATTFINNVEIDSNRITAGYYSILINGRTSTPYANNIRIRRNNIDSAFYYGVYVNYIDAIKFINNNLNMRVNGNANSQGLYLNNLYTTGTNFHEISNNRIHGAGQNGIYSWFCSNTSTARGKMINNMIGGSFRTSNAMAVNWNYSDFWDIWNNTMQTDIATSSAQSAVMYINGFTNQNNLDIRNNVFYYAAASGTGLPFYVNGPTSFTAFNFNNFYKAGTAPVNLIFINGTTYTSANYQGGGGFNASSVSSANNYLGVRDFHLTSAGAKGTTIAQVTTDIDGESRQTPPDLGADEYYSSMDIGVLSIDSPASAGFCSGPRNVVVRLRNYGNQNIISANIQVLVDGVLQLITPWSGSLGLGATSGPINVGQVNFSSGNPVITAFTSNPNGGTDINASNDTASRAYTITQTVVPTISINASNTAICSGTSVTLRATYTNGGSTPLIQWRRNGITYGNTDSIVTSALANNDSIICILSSSATCATPSSVTSNSIIMNVNTTQPAVVTIAASSTNICTGQNVTFTATPTNGGTRPSYQWKRNGINVGADTAIYQSNGLSNGDSITLVMTSNLSCASPNIDTSNFIKMTVNNFVTPSVSIVASATAICSGVVDTFTATPVNGGAAPVYQWKRNGVNVGTNNNRYITSTLANNDTIQVVMTSNAACALPAQVNSNKIGLTVTPSVTPTIVMTPTSTSICSGTLVTFTSAITHGGGTPSYQWRKNNLNVGTDTNVYTDNNLQNNDSIFVVLTSNAVCATSANVNSNKVRITVNPVSTPDVTINASANNICSSTPVQFNATPVNGGTAPSYQWRRNGIIVGS
ncbi:MAG: beta strand repeat-containing protein, partial [Bacteroidota bacterium]